MLLTLYLTGPLLGGWSLATSMYIGNMASVALLTWVLMPNVTRWLSFWLNPPANAGAGNLYGGLAVVLGGQLLMVALFKFFMAG